MFHYFTDATALNNALLTNAVDVVTSEQSPDALAQFKDNKDYKVNDGHSTTKLLLAFNDRVAPFDNVARPQGRSPRRSTTRSCSTRSGATTAP